MVGGRSRPRIRRRRGSQVQDSPAPADSDRAESRRVAATYAQMSGPVYSTRTRNYHADLDSLRTLISLPAWPHNGLRHSFASYHLAFHQDAAALMLQMGHTTTREIFESYRELVRPDEAQEYWNIRPKLTPATVIPILNAKSA